MVPVILTLLKGGLPLLIVNGNRGAKIMVCQHEMCIYEVFQKINGEDLRIRRKQMNTQSDYITERNASGFILKLE